MSICNQGTVSRLCIAADDEQEEPNDAQAFDDESNPSHAAP
jgi:hypothetical protein